MHQDKYGYNIPTGIFYAAYKNKPKMVKNIIEMLLPDVRISGVAAEGVDFTPLDIAAELVCTGLTG